MTAVLARFDLDAADVLRVAGSTFDHDGIGTQLQRSMVQHRLPVVGARALRVIPLPPARAVFVTVMYLAYIRQSADAENLFWTGLLLGRGRGN